MESESRKVRAVLRVEGETELSDTESDAEIVRYLVEQDLRENKN